MGFEIKCNKCGATMQLVDTLDSGNIEFAWYENRISIVCLG